MTEYYELYALLKTYYEKAVYASVKAEVYTGDNCRLGQKHLGNAMHAAVSYIAESQLPDTDKEATLTQIGQEFVQAALYPRFYIARYYLEGARRWLGDPNVSFPDSAVWNGYRASWNALNQEYDVAWDNMFNSDWLMLGEEVGKLGDNARNLYDVIVLSLGMFPQ